MSTFEGLDALLYPNAERLCLLSCQDWDSKFAPYRWFRVACYSEAMSKSGLRLADLTDINVRRAAVDAVPESWRQACSLQNWKTASQVGWSVISPSQIRDAFHRLPLNFPKACLALLALREAAEKRGHDGQAVIQATRIHPALYRVEGFTPEFYKANIKYNPEIRAELRNISLQNDHHVLEKMAEGYCATYETARRASKFLKERFPEIGDPYIQEERNDSSAKKLNKEPCPKEKMRCLLS